MFASRIGAVVWDNSWRAFRKLQGLRPHLGDSDSVTGATRLNFSDNREPQSHSPHFRGAHGESSSQCQTRMWRGEGGATWSLRGTKSKEDAEIRNERQWTRHTGSRVVRAERRAQRRRKGKRQTDGRSLHAGGRVPHGWGSPTCPRSHCSRSSAVGARNRYFKKRSPGGEPWSTGL